MQVSLAADTRGVARSDERGYRAAMAAMSSAGESEWIGGASLLPHYVTGDGDAPFRPEAFLWLDSEGLVVGTTLFRAGEATSKAGAFFRETTRALDAGAARAPTRVRVASAELAEALRREIGDDVEVVCAATPELDDALASLIEHLSKGGGDDPPTYLTAGITPAAMARMFRAAATLYRAQPWKVISDEALPATVSIPELGVSDAPLSLLGLLGEHYGFLLFPDRAALERFLHVTAGLMSGASEDARLPPHCYLELVARKELEPELAKEIKHHRWDIAGPRAYPLLSATDGEGIARPVTSRELAVVEALALALALAAHVAAPESMAAFPVETSQGLVHVAFGFDDELDEDDVENPFAESFDIHADLSDLDEIDEIDEERAMAFEEELVDRFAESIEARSLEDGAAFWSSTLLDIARTYHGVTVTALTAPIVGEIVFGDIPLKVSCDPEDAPRILAALRAFFAYLERAHGLADVARCAAEVLGPKADAQLHERLSDPRNFGMAKSLFMDGKAAGFDMKSADGAAAWLGAMNRKLDRSSAPPATSAWLPGPSAPRPSAETRAKKKSKRKAARASRRKSRR